MKRSIHFPQTDWIILILVLAITGGFAGVYRIQARPNVFRADIATGENGKLLPDEPIVVNFPVRALPENYDGKITINSGINAKTEWKDAKQDPDLPQEHPRKPAEAQKYEVIVYTKYTQNADSNYKDIYSSSFITFPLKPQVCDKSSSVQVEAATAAAQPAILEGKYIDINLSSQMLSLFQDGALLDSYPVSTGRIGMETPRGTHAIANKSPRAWSRKYGVFLPYWMAITPNGVFGIHELPENPSGDREGANDLGIPVSHGCVRLDIGPAERVYNWAEIGTPVVVY